MAVPYSWLVNVTVNVNTSFVTPPNFNSCSLAVVSFTVPTTGTWSQGYNNYTSSISFLNDFQPILTALLGAGSVDYIAVNRVQWAMNAVTAFFAQPSQPTQLYVFNIPTVNSSTNYSTVLNTYTGINNNWYGMTICENIQANAYSMVVGQILTTSAGVVIPAGTALTTGSPPAASTYILKQRFTTGAAGTYNLIFYSTDVSTAFLAASFNGLMPLPSGVSTVTNPNPARINQPGYLTPSVGINTALLALRTNNNQKKMFGDFNDFTQPGIIQSSLTLSSQDLTCFTSTLNFPQYYPVAFLPNPNNGDSLSAASMSQYFTNLFVNNNGLGILSSMQLAAQIPDPFVTANNIGTPNPLVAGSITNLIGWNNNVYASFGNNVLNIGLVQYGFQSNSNNVAGSIVYLDQVVGNDYVQLTTQQNLVNLIVNSLPSGLPYSDTGIQSILNEFKASIQNAVDQGVLQPISNANFTYPTYAQCSPANIASRIYTGMTFTGNYLSRIQMINVVINLSL